MQIKSSCGQFSNVCVGTRLSPLSLGTGASDLATICITDWGKRARTCCGPVKSSCVSSGNMTNPTLKSDISCPPLLHRVLSRLPAEGSLDSTPLYGPRLLGSGSEASTSFTISLISQSLKATPPVAYVGVMERDVA